MACSHDLTSGSIPQHFLRLAAPLILGNILQQLYNTVDAFVLGHFSGSQKFAAVGVASSVMNLFLFMITGACTGISVLFAQFYGAGDLSSFRKEHAHSLGLGIIVTLFFSILGFLFLPYLLKFIRTPESLTSAVSTYLHIILLSLPVTFLYNLYSALLRSVGRANAALLALVGAVTVNIVLDYWFVALLKWGIAGAAWATAASQLLAAILCLLWLCRKTPELLFQKKDLHPDSSLLRRTLHFGFVAGLHQSSLYIGKLLVQGAVNTGGTELITAYTATTRIEGFANSFGDSGAAATSVLVAQNTGAGQKERVRSTFRSSLLLMLLIGLLMSVIMFVSADASITFLLGSSGGSAYENARSYMQLISFFYVFCFIGNTFAGYFDGLGNGSMPSIGARTHITLREILSWLLVGRMGLPAVALATGLGWILVNTMWTIIKHRLTQKGRRKLKIFA